MSHKNEMWFTVDIFAHSCTRSHTVCDLPDLRQELGVSIRSLIGPNMEPVSLGPQNVLSYLIGIGSVCGQEISRCCRNVSRSAVQLSRKVAIAFQLIVRFYSNDVGLSAPW